MPGIYSFGSHNMSGYRFHPTQGNNESYGEFSTRVQGIKLGFKKPTLFTSTMSFDSSSSSSSSFEDNFHRASFVASNSNSVANSPICYSPASSKISVQSVNVELHKDGAGAMGCRTPRPASAPAIEHFEREFSEQPTEIKRNESIWRRMLTFLSPCSRSVSKVKK